MVSERAMRFSTQESMQKNYCTSNSTNGGKSAATPSILLSASIAHHMSGAGGVVTGVVTGRAARARHADEALPHEPRRRPNLETCPPRVISSPTPSRFVTVQHLAVRKFQAFTHVY